MTATKEQERKALEQIRKIVAGLGENSYIGTAFEGCFEDAETNIENDFAFSWKQRAEGREADANYWRQRHEKLYEDFENCKGKMEKVRIELSEQNESLKTEIERLNKQIAYDDKQLDEAIKASNTNAEFYMKEQVKTAELQKQIKEQAQTIIELKAKLYDLITAN